MKRLEVEILPPIETEESQEFQDWLRPEYNLSKLRKVVKNLGNIIGKYPVLEDATVIKDKDR